MSLNNFDLVAPVYDGLAKLVFGNQLLKAQIHFLNQVRLPNRVLIAGGGRGELLEKFPICRTIDYVEKSKKMIGLASKRSFENKVRFINQDFLDFSSSNQYDVIICPFFLDCFNEENLKLAILKCKKLLKKDGILILTEFQYTKKIKFVIKLMHWFFRLVACLESRELKDINTYVLREGVSLEKEFFYCQRTVFSRFYRNQC